MGEYRMKLSELFRKYDDNTLFAITLESNTIVCGRAKDLKKGPCREVVCSRLMSEVESVLSTERLSIPEKIYVVSMKYKKGEYEFVQKIESTIKKQSPVEMKRNLDDLYIRYRDLVERIYELRNNCNEVFMLDIANRMEAMYQAEVKVMGEKILSERYCSIVCSIIDEITSRKTDESNKYHNIFLRNIHLMVTPYKINSAVSYIIQVKNVLDVLDNTIAEVNKLDSIHNTSAFETIRYHIRKMQDIENNLFNTVFESAMLTNMIDDIENSKS